MLVVTVQAPTAPGAARTDPATPSAFALPAVQTVSSVQGIGTQPPLADDRPSATTPQALPTPKVLDPFPEMRFADPLPDLPDLELPPSAHPYLAALSIVRPDGPR